VGSSLTNAASRATRSSKADRSVASTSRRRSTGTIIFDIPLEYTGEGSLRAHIVGEEAVIREVIPQVPDDIGLNLEQISDYAPEEERLFSMLTERQRETPRAALEVGYYRVPREATHQEVADRLDRSDGTVGEHLRKMEAQVMAAIAP